MNDLVFCLDSGTTAVKAAAYTLDGVLVALHETPNGALKRDGVRAEQEMGQTRDEALATLQQCVAKATGQARGLIITAQGEGVWPVDAAMQPLGRASTWLDGRAVDLLTELDTAGILAAVADITGAQPTAASPSVQLLWLQRHEPERYRRIAHVLRAKEWLFHALTGELVSEPSTAMLTWGDWRRQVVADAIERHIGLEAAMRRLPPLGSIADSRRPLTAQAAALTGLPQGLPVMLGPSDVQATAIGLGVGVRDGVRRASIFGTSAIHVGYFPNAASLPEKPRGAMLQPSIDAGAFLCVHPCFNGSTTFRHLQALVGGDTAPGALSGAMLQPFFEPGGERAPITDPHARAALLGLTSSTDAAQLQRAAREALAFNARLSHDSMGGDGSAVSFGGGLANDDAFAALLATVLGRRVLRPAVAHAGLAGIGLIATHHLTEKPLREVATRWLAAEAHVDEPASGDETRFLQRKFALHRKLLDTLAPLWVEMASLQDEAQRLNEGIGT